MTTIARAYETEQKAQEAKADLIAAGMTEDRVTIITPYVSSAGDGLRAGKSLGQHRDAEAYARALDKGQTVLLADVHFGTGVSMSTIMDKFDPVVVEQVSDVDDPYHPGTPMSLVLGMPVLIRNNPAPLSRFFGLSTESSGRSFLRKLFGGELSDNAAPLSSAVSMNTVSEGGTTTSSKFGMKELYTEELGTKTFGMSLLSSNATPLSSALGMKCLSGNPAPLSTMFGMGVLSGLNDKTPAPPPPPTQH